MSGKKPRYFENILPDEIIVIIGSFLQTPADLSSFELTCRRFRNIVRERVWNIIWQLQYSIYRIPYYKPGYDMWKQRMLSKSQGPPNNTDLVSDARRKHMYFSKDGTPYKIMFDRYKLWWFTHEYDQVYFGQFPKLGNLMVSNNSYDNGFTIIREPKSMQINGFKPFTYPRNRCEKVGRSVCVEHIPITNEKGMMILINESMDQVDCIDTDFLMNQGYGSPLKPFCTLDGCTLVSTTQGLITMNHNTKDHDDYSVVYESGVVVAGIMADRDKNICMHIVDPLYGKSWMGYNSSIEDTRFTQSLENCIPLDLSDGMLVSKSFRPHNQFSIHDVRQCLSASITYTLVADIMETLGIQQMKICNNGMIVLWRPTFELYRCGWWDIRYPSKSCLHTFDIPSNQAKLECRQDGNYAVNVSYGSSISFTTTLR